MKTTFLSAAALLATCGCLFATSTVVAHYKMGELEFNGGAGTPVGGTAPNALPTTGSVNLPVAGSPTIQAGGPANALNGSTHFMRFDGGDTQRYEVAGNLLGAGTTGDWMLEAWVRPQAGGTGLGLIVSHGHGGAGQVLNFNASNGKYGWLVGGVGLFEGSATASGVGTTWDHLALVRTGGTTTLYVNGVFSGSDGVQGTTPYANGSAIGSQVSGGADLGFTGDIDEVYFSTVSGFNADADLHMTNPPDPWIIVPTGPVSAGTVAVSTTSGRAWVDIDNDGASNTLVISSVAPQSGDTAKFTLLTPLPLNILPGGTGSLEFQYAPGATAASHSAVVTIGNNDVQHPNRAVTLTGTAITDPNLIVSTASVNFGTIAATVGPTGQSLNVTNTAFTNDLTLSLAITGTDAGKFSIVGFTSPVTPGATEPISLQYNPAGAIGTHNATLQITHNDPDLTSPALVSLTGTAVPRHEIVARFRMGEDEAAGGTTVGNTPATLIDAAGDFDMAPTGTPALANTGSAPSTPASTHHMNFAGTTDYYARSGNIVAASNASTNWLIECWVKPAELPAGGNFCMADGNGAGGAVIFQQGNHFGLGLGGNAFALGSAPVVAGQWYHVALVKEPTFNGGKATLLVNGVIDHSLVFGGTATPAVAAASIGAQSNGQAIWNGDIDEAYYAKIYAFNPATDLHLTIDTDADGDDLLDAWEDQYFGNNDDVVTWSELVATDGSGDADGDGASDQAEHDAGTDPQDPDDVPPAGPVITSITKSGTTVTVVFTGVDGQGYVLKKSANLQDGFPVTCGSITLSGTTTGQLQDTSATANRAFYRVEDQ